MHKDALSHDNPHQILVVSRRAGGTRPPAGYRVIRVDRVSVLGNPFVMTSESDRDLVCNQYDTWFAERLLNDSSDVARELRGLVDIYTRGDSLALECWCAPKRCHAESIRAAILRVADLRLASR